jgi:hypothetical protein
MTNKPESATVLISGRVFTTQELQEIEETVRLFPRLSRKELAKTICEHLWWVTPNGQYKTASCLQLLEKLEARGAIVLPEKKDTSRFSGEEVILGAGTDAGSEIAGSVGDFAPIELEPVRTKEGIRLWNEYVERYHDLGYKRPFGAHQRYFIVTRGKEEQRLGCMLFAASAWALSERDEWIGWTQADRSQRLHLIVNNTRFLIFPWVHIRNLASKALSLAARRIRLDWQVRYGYRPVLLETFVDGGKYRGTSYQAANWIRLGETAGRGRMDRYKQYLSTPKEIYVYPLVADFRAYLRGERRWEDG